MHPFCEISSGGPGLIKSEIVWRNWNCTNLHIVSGIIVKKAQQTNSSKNDMQVFSIFLWNRFCLFLEKNRESRKDEFFPSIVVDFPKKLHSLRKYLCGFRRNQTVPAAPLHGAVVGTAALGAATIIQRWSRALCQSRRCPKICSLVGIERISYWGHTKVCLCFTE